MTNAIETWNKLNAECSGASGCGVMDMEESDEEPISKGSNVSDGEEEEGDRRKR